MTTNVMVRDLDLAEPNAADTRRLDFVADGLPLFRGTQLAIDTTIVSTLHANGAARRVHEDGAALEATRRVSGRPGRARLVVLGVEVCGRWSLETKSFLSSLARAFNAESPGAGLATSLGVLFSCTTARSVGCLCLNSLGPEALMATVHRPTMWNGISDMPVWTRSDSFAVPCPMFLICDLDAFF